MSRLFELLYFTKNCFYSFISTLICRVKMTLLGIDCGKGTIFRGVTLFFRAQDSTIKIGKNNTFNSSCRYNFRGINHKCIIQTSRKGSITIGDNCGFSGVSIVSSVSVQIGNNVMCGTNVMIGDRNDHEDLYPQFKPAPVFIGNNVWIGMNTVIMKGVTIGDNVIIGANSLVTKDIPSNVIAFGSPCKPIKENK